MLTTRKRPTSILIALLALVAAACSGSDEVADPSTTSTTTEDSSTTEQSSTTTTEATTTTTVASTTSEAPPAESDEFPAVMWGIEADTFDLVEVDITSGEVLRRIVGWGAEFADPDREGGLQALQTVDVVDDSIWTGDCCEPAAGGVFGVDPDRDQPVPESSVSGFGTDPVISPDGELVAVGALDIGVSILDAATGEQLVDPALIGELLTPPEGSVPPLLPRPLAWLDATTVVVAQTTDEGSNVVMIDVADRAGPVVASPVIQIRDRIVDGAVNGDSELVLALFDPTGEVTFGQVFSPDTGAEIAQFALDPDTASIDYDASGRFLLVSRVGRNPAWQGAGSGGVLPGPQLVDGAWDAGGAAVPTDD